MTLRWGTAVELMILMYACSVGLPTSGICAHKGCRLYQLLPLSKHSLHILPIKITRREKVSSKSLQEQYRKAKRVNERSEDSQAEREAIETPKSAVTQPLNLASLPRFLTLVSYQHNCNSKPENNSSERKKPPRGVLSYHVLADYAQPPTIYEYNLYSRPSNHSLHIPTLHFNPSPIQIQPPSLQQHSMPNTKSQFPIPHHQIPSTTSLQHPQNKTPLPSTTPLTNPPPFQPIILQPLHHPTRNQPTTPHPIATHPRQPNIHPRKKYPIHPPNTPPVQQ